jgi:DNA polymerase (family X)
MDNYEIAGTFDEIADLLEITGANFFRVRAYRNAARAIQDHPAPVAQLSREELAEIPGIGDDLAGKIVTLNKTGELEIHRELKKKVPQGLLDLRQITGLGPKRIKLLFETLKVKGREDLKRAADAGALAGVPGFGPKMEQRIRAALAGPERKASARMAYANAERIVNALLAHMKGCRDALRVEPAGSFRRRRETVGDLDLLALARDAKPVVDRLLSFPQVAETLGAGDTKATVVLKDGLQVDLRVVEPRNFGAAIVYFTGSKAHCVHLRTLAQRRGLLLNEYGLWRGDKLLAGEDEEGIYRALKLDWIAPELREDRGEIEAAAEHRLPALIERKQLRGDLHTHSTWTDGRASIEEMAKSARAAGLEYIAVTDHSQRLAMARGLDAARLREQWREIDRVGARLQDFRLLKGIEVDILEDGGLDLPEDALKELDWVVASVHSKLEQEPKQMTRRIVNAIRNPYVNAIGHPSNRLLDRRPASRYDFDEVLRVAHEEGCALEVNSQPDRLDLIDTACLAAKHAGVRLVISSDSHGPRGFDLLEYGVNQARRGWIERDDVLNTRTAAKLRERR